MIYIDIFFLPPISDLSSTIKDFGHMDTGQCASVFTRACHSDLQSKCWQMMPKKFKPQFRFAKLLSAQHPSSSLLPHVWPLTQTCIFSHFLRSLPEFLLVYAKKQKPKSRSQIHRIQALSSGKERSSDIDDHHFLPLGKTIAFMGPHISSVEMQQKY